MLNDRLGVHANKGRFYVFSLQHAIDVMSLLVDNSYVRFGDHVFHQTRGIPMGINPAVFLANYYLFCYELAFVQQLVSAIQEHTQHREWEVTPDDITVALDTLSAPDTAHEVSGELKAIVARVLLESFRFTVRFVDDFTSGPNPHLTLLLYCTDTVLQGTFKGIYPESLSLEKTGNNPLDFSTLDVRIISTQQANGVMESFTVLFDKRRQECYARLPIVQYTHISSMLSESSGYNIIISQLHRFKELIMSIANYVLESAKLVRRLQLRAMQSLG